MGSITRGMRLPHLKAMDTSLTSLPAPLDFSGAPPLLIPQAIAHQWHGNSDPETGEYRELNTESPVTDYDRACNVAWPGKGVLDVHGEQCLILYTESDAHTWDSRRNLLACCGWLPTDEQLQVAEWNHPIVWQTRHKCFLLMNSAADASLGLIAGESMPVELPAGTYLVECADITSEYVGCFYRFRRQGEPDWPGSPRL